MSEANLCSHLFPEKTTDPGPPASRASRLGEQLLYSEHPLEAGPFSSSKMEMGYLMLEYKWIAEVSLQHELNYNYLNKIKKTSKYLSASSM